MNDAIKKFNSMIKVYIVEDSPVMVERIEAELQTDPGVELVGVADNEEEALHDIAALNPDFLILDIMLKSGDGINVLKKVKSERPDITISMLTNYSTPEFSDKCKTLGADFFFDKAKDFSKLIEAVTASRAG